MEKQVTGKELRKSMEYLVKLLHKEWERSGKTKAEVTISITDADTINQTLADRIMQKQNLLDMEGLDFTQSMALSKENFVLLRLVKKVKKEEDKTNKRGLDMEFTVELDLEEYKLFQEIVAIEEA